MAVASSRNSITVASIAVSRDASDAASSSREPSPASTIPEDQELEPPRDLNHEPEPVSEPVPESVPESVPEPVREPERDHDVEMDDANGVVAAPTESPVPFPITAGPVITSNLGHDDAVLIPPARNGYEKSNLDEITVRQLYEDMSAYNYDLSFCRAQLEEDDLTPQESRTFQLRILDLGHQIRHCQHRIETLRISMRGKPLRGSYGVTTSFPANHASVGPTSNGAAITNGNSKPLLKRTNTNTSISTPVAPTPSNKRPASHLNESTTNHQDENTKPNGTPIVSKRSKTHQSEPASPPDHDTSIHTNGADGDNLALQRLGYWKCRLCEAPKYLLAGSGRSPAMPCKWPLKDISKMITHFTEMHGEHAPAERCTELGSALARNRGPFEYWLRRTRAQNVGDGSVMDECIDTLVAGTMPSLLRRLSRAAAGMPAA